MYKPDAQTPHSEPRRQNRHAVDFPFRCNALMHQHTTDRYHPTEQISKALCACARPSGRAFFRQRLVEKQHHGEPR